MTTVWHSREQLVHQAVTLKKQGLSQRAIARSLGISRNTVKQILKTHEAQRTGEHCALPAKRTRAPRPSKLDDYKGRVGELFAKYPDITAQRVFEILRGEGFGGGYTAVKAYVRKVRPKKAPTPSLPTPSYGPGQMAESDWSPYSLTFTNGTKQTVQLFSYVLVYSKRKFFEAYDSYDLHALMAGHVAAFERFGGCGHRCKYDGQKAVVARWEGTQPIYNPRFLAFCTHYEMRPWAIRGNPNLRPRVERGFWEHEQSFLKGRDFVDLFDFRRQLHEWLNHTVDHRKRRGTTPLSRFAEESGHLLPLPQKPYDTARVIYRVCSIDGFIDWQANRYAVPYDHVTDILPVRITENELFVYAADLSCIARHELALRGEGCTLDPEGFHSYRKKAAIDLDQLREAYERMGQGAIDFFGALSATPPRRWTHQARQILQLRQRYATCDLDAALGHAAHFGALSASSVERILEACHRPRTLDEYVAAETAERMERLWGPGQTEPCDLSAYDRLPTADDISNDNQESYLCRDKQHAGGEDNREVTVNPTEVNQQPNR